MLELNELFAAAGEIGSKYQSGKDRQAFQSALDAVNDEIIRDAVKRGEYDQEKGIWLV